MLEGQNDRGAQDRYRIAWPQMVESGGTYNDAQQGTDPNVDQKLGERPWACFGWCACVESIDGDNELVRCHGIIFMMPQDATGNQGYADE